jgi:hypothetical protein
MRGDNLECSSAMILIDRSVFRAAANRRQLHVDLVNRDSVLRSKHSREVGVLFERSGSKVEAQSFLPVHACCDSTPWTTYLVSLLRA